MGLDNGIVIKKTKNLDIPALVKISDRFSDGDIELVYWRKCWGIRYHILDILHVDIQGEGEFKIEDAQEVKLIIKELYKFLDRDYWDRKGDSIWDYDEFLISKMVQDIINLKWLVFLMEENPDIEVEFYDSY